MNKFLLAIPALMDVITSGLNMVALNFVSGSVYQMMKGGSIISTMIFSVIFLKVVVKKRQIFGSILVLIGVFLVGLSNTIFKDSTGVESNIVLFKNTLGYANCWNFTFGNGIHLKWIYVCL